MRYVAMVNASTGKTLAGHAGVADTIFTHFLGPQGKRQLLAGLGLILLPSNGIHLFCMLLRINAVFVGEGGRVLRVVCARGRLVPSCRAHSTARNCRRAQLPIHRPDT